jgi:hypothetical protein
MIWIKSGSARKAENRQENVFVGRHHGGDERGAGCKKMGAADAISRSRRGKKATAPLI